MNDNTSKRKEYPTLSTLERLRGRESVSKQYISDLAHSAHIKHVEREIILRVLADEDHTVNVKTFAKKVKAELLPLVVQEARGAKSHTRYSSGRYESISLPDYLRGNVADYAERVYESPISTLAGDIHFSGNEYKNYFGHTRIEDMAPEKLPDREDFKNNYKGYIDFKKNGGTTRRVIEVQSDLYQKGNLDNETLGPYRPNVRYDIKNPVVERDTPTSERLEELSRLQQYNDPSAHFRIVREEVKQAAKDGKTKLQFPTGESIMLIEGLGIGEVKWQLDSLDSKGNWIPEKLTIENLRVGATARRTFVSSDQWIIVEVCGNGKFRAVPKDQISNYEARELAKGSYVNDVQNASSVEEFDISGKIDKSNPIYKFYENDIGRYLKNKYNAQIIKDEQGITWHEIRIRPEMATESVLAFDNAFSDLERKNLKINQLNKTLKQSYVKNNVYSPQNQIHMKGIKKQPEKYGNGKEDSIHSKAILWSLPMLEQEMRKDDLQNKDQKALSEIKAVRSKGKDIKKDFEMDGKYVNKNKTHEG